MKCKLAVIIRKWHDYLFRAEAYPATKEIPAQSSRAVLDFCQKKTGPSSLLTFPTAEVRLPEKPFRSRQRCACLYLKPAVSAPLPHFKFPCEIRDQFYLMYLFLGLILGISFEMLYLGIKYRYLCSWFLKNCLRAKEKDFFAEDSFPIRHITLSLAFPREYWKKSTGRIEFINLGLITSQTRSYLWEHSDPPYSSGFIE